MKKLLLEKQVARNLEDLLYDGQITSATTNGTYAEVVCDDFPFSDNSDLEGGKIWIGSKTHLIRVFSPQDNKLYVLPTFATTPASGATIHIFKNFTKEHYDQTFEQVFTRLSNKVLTDVEASIAVASKITYDIPTNWKYVNRVELYQTTSLFPIKFLENTEWRLRVNNLTLLAALATESYATMYMIGQAHPDEPATDDTEIGQSGIFEQCLSFRMMENLAGSKIKQLKRTSAMSATKTATITGTLARTATQTRLGTLLGTQSLLATLAGTANILGTQTQDTLATRSLIGTLGKTLTATTSAVGTTVATITTIDHETGKIESSDENREESQTDQETSAENTQQSDINQEGIDGVEQESQDTSEVKEEGTTDQEAQEETTTELAAESTTERTLEDELQDLSEIEENWLPIVEYAKDAADALEVYLFERVRPNSRRVHA